MIVVHIILGVKIGGLVTLRSTKAVWIENDHCQSYSGTFWVLSQKYMVTEQRFRNNRYLLGVKLKISDELNTPDNFIWESPGLIGLIPGLISPGYWKYDQGPTLKTVQPFLYFQEEFSKFLSSFLNCVTHNSCQGCNNSTKLISNGAIWPLCVSKVF